jgi:hypothetical protein
MAKVYIVDGQIAGIATAGVDIFPTIDAPDGYGLDDLYIDKSGKVKVKPPAPDRSHIWDNGKWRSLEVSTVPAIDPEDSKMLLDAAEYADTDPAVQGQLLITLYAQTLGLSDVVGKAKQKLKKLLKDKTDGSSAK